MLLLPKQIMVDQVVSEVDQDKVVSVEDSIVIIIDPLLLTLVEMIKLPKRELLVSLRERELLYDPVQLLFLFILH
jgi:hypothetical protein